MAFELEWHADPAYLEIRFSGDLTADVMLQAFQAVLGDPHWRPGTDLLWDLRAITRFIMQPDDLGTLAESLTQHVTEFGVARTAVVAKDEVSFSISVLLGIRSRRIAGRDVRIFTAKAEAVSWLARPES